jgi:CRISPR-associated protein (TIGR02710 family)
MNRALFMTVGTGVGDSEERIHSLAHGLLQSIKQHRPDKIVFFGSELSKKTLKSMKNQSNKVLSGDLPFHEFILIQHVDEFNDCFMPIKDKITEYSDYDVLIDYTSGTKTMTMSASICSVLYHKDLVMVSGSRNPSGVVKSHTEIPKPQNIYKVYDEILFNEFKVHFNTLRFQSAIETLDKIVELDNKEGYRKLTLAYQAWDLFEHQKCKEILTNSHITYLEGLKDSITINLSILGVLGNPKQKNKSVQMVADLLKNAQRRGFEEKYDDAVARLYRTVELIAQCTLKDEFGLDTSDLDTTKLSDLSRRKMKLEPVKDGTIKLGMHSAFTLLRYEGNNLGIKFDNDNQIKDLLKRRNQSILAHGLTPIEKEDYKKLMEKTIELATEAYPNIETLMKKAEFPKLR